MRDRRRPNCRSDIRPHDDRGKYSGGAKVTVAMYGIKNCDTIKKARAWLEGHGIAYAFHDYKLRGIDRATLEGWIAKAGWEKIVNRSGTTFRKLPDELKDGLDAERAIQLMIDQPSMIKRPLLDVDGRLVVGFNPETYAEAFTR